MWMLFSSCYISIQILQYKVSGFLCSIQEETGISEQGKESVLYTGVKLFHLAVLTRGTFAGTFYARLGTSYEEGSNPLLPQGKKKLNYII